MSKTPDKNLKVDRAIPGGVSNEITPVDNETEAVRRRDDLTIRGADPKEVVPQEPRKAKDGSPPRSA